MKKSAFLEEIREEGRRQGRLEIEGLDVKKSAFLEEIRKESRQEGRLEKEASMIVQLLRTRFPNQVPADLSAIIEATRDGARLEHWFSIAATETSIEGFRKASGL